MRRVTYYQNSRRQNHHVCAGCFWQCYESLRSPCRYCYLKQIETRLYGSGRLGILGEQTVLSSPVNLTGGFSAATVSTFTRGEKFFEMSNHLGNVLVTISDKKIQHTTNSTVVDYWNADVVTATDYAPFGMQLVGRKFSGSSSYRYGFNGKENDNEVKGEALSRIME